MAGSSVIGALRVVMGMDVAQFEEGTKRAGRSMDSLAAKAKQVGGAIGGAFLAAKIASFASEAVHKFGIQEQAIAAVEAAVKQTGGSAGFTTAQLAKMAAGLQKISTFGDEEILGKVTANLLTFGNITGEVFEKAQLAALNLSARLGQDLQSSTIQLGKALNDPIKGFTALQRVGVAFTDAQKSQIKTLVASNRVMDAQKIILKELESEFGGQAAAIANTTAGKLKQAANAFGDAMEAVGKTVAPAIEPVIETVQALSEGFQALDPHTQAFIVGFAGAAGVLGAVTLQAGIAAMVFGALSLPLLAVVGTIAAVSAALFAWGPNIKRVAVAVAGYFYEIYAAAKRYLYDSIKPIIDKVVEWFDWLYKKVTWVADQIGLTSVATEVKASAQKMVDGLAPYEQKLTDLWNGTEKLKAATSNLPAPVPKIPKGYDPEALGNAQRDLNKHIQEGVSLVKQAESPWDKYARQMQGLNAALSAGKINAQQFALAQRKIYDEAKVNFEGGAALVDQYRSPYEKMQETVRKLNDQYQAGAISATALGRAQAQAAIGAGVAYADMASNIAGNLAEVFKKNKAVAMAAGTIDAIGAALKALAAYPPPFSYIAAAAALAAGMAKVAAIRSTNENSGGSAGAAAGGAGGAAAGGAGGQAAAPKQGVYISLKGESYGREQVRGLITQINAAVADGAVLRVA
jgi:hypothetical protein